MLSTQLIQFSWLKCKSSLKAWYMLHMVAYMLYGKLHFNPTNMDKCVIMWWKSSGQFKIMYHIYDVHVCTENQDNLCHFRAFWTHEYVYFYIRWTFFNLMDYERGPIIFSILEKKMHFSLLFSWDAHFFPIFFLRCSFFPPHEKQMA